MKSFYEFYLQIQREAALAPAAPGAAPAAPAAPGAAPAAAPAAGATPAAPGAAGTTQPAAPQPPPEITNFIKGAGGNAQKASELLDAFAKGTKDANLKTAIGTIKNAIAPAAPPKPGAPVAPAAPAKPGAPVAPAVAPK